MVESTLLVNVSLADLRDIIDTSVRKSVADALTNLPAPSAEERDDLLSRKETGRLLRVSPVTLNVWEKRGVLTPVRIGRRVLYRRSDVDKALQSAGKPVAKRGRA